MALSFDLILNLIQRLITPWERATQGWISALADLIPAASIEGALEFIFEQQASNVTGGELVGGLDQTVELALTQLEVTLFALTLSMGRCASARLSTWDTEGSVGSWPSALATPAWAIPELALIAFMGGMDRGRGRQPDDRPRCARRAADPQSNAYVGIRQVDPAPVEAARGIGMTELETLLQGRAAARDPDDHGRGATGDDRDHQHGDDRAPGLVLKRSATTSSTKTSTARTALSPARSSSP